MGLSASHDLNLLSQAEQHTQSQSQANAGGEVGVSIGQTTGIYATVSGGKGRTHGNGTTHLDTQVSADDTLSLIAGHDATIKGAQATGNTVLADIGHYLNIVSEQDTNDYASNNWQGSVTVVYGFSGGGAGVSGSASAGQTDSKYKSVTQTSGIAAGDGGYNIYVGNHTDLTGGVIASTADPSKNLFSTGSLSYSDIQNEASYSAWSASVGGGYGTGSAGGMTGFYPGGSVPQGKDESSTTKAGIAQGTIDVRDNPGQNLSGLDRNPDIDAQGLKTIFDAQKVAENQEVGQVASQIGMTAVGDLAQRHRVAANNEMNKAEADYEKAKAAGDEYGMAQASQAWNDARDDYQSWADGSQKMAMLHGFVGAAVAALGEGNAVKGGLGAAAGEAATPMLADKFGRNEAVLGAFVVGGLVSGGNGASTASAGARYNYLSHDQKAQESKEKKACGTNLMCLVKVNAKWSAVSGKQNVGLGVGVVAGIGVSGRNAVDAIAYMEPKQVFEGLKALLSDHTVAAQLGADAVTSLRKRLKYAQQQMQVAGWDGSVNAGAAIGSVLFDVASAVSAVKGGVSLAKDLPLAARQVGGAVNDLGALVRSGKSVSTVTSDVPSVADAVAADSATNDALGTSSHLLPDSIQGDGLAGSTAQDAINAIQKGELPGTPINGLGTPREMPVTSNPSAAAEEFASEFFGGSKPANAIPMPNGGWRAAFTNADGTETWVTYRPAGEASSRTLGTTATVEVNGSQINQLNGGPANVLKLKFPKTGATGPGGGK